MTDRKKDHIEMAFDYRTDKKEADSRFHYEPMLAAHHGGNFQPFEFAGKTMNLPVWISSMTGGTPQAGTINRNLASACGEFGLGMGLGSCRSLLESNRHLSDFDVRQYMGDDVPLFANLGISQLEQLVAQKQEHKVEELVKKLKADGVIIHVNPLQEAFQNEGDHLKVPPVETIETLLFQTDLRIMVKEVGQGMGPASLQRLLTLPLEAIEFGALGGTNFTKLEISRKTGNQPSQFDHFSRIGHTAEEMARFVNDIAEKETVRCRQLIISGGITNVADGYYLIQNSKLKAVFGMASAFLQHARGDYDELQTFVNEIKKGLGIAEQYLK